MRTQKRLSAELMKVGINRVRVNIEDEEAVAAMTREEIRSAIKRGAIYKVPPKGTSKGRARKLKLARKKGRRRGHGSRKGKATARRPKKKEWAKKIRAIRKKLKEMRNKKEIKKKEYRKAYRHASAGVYRSKAHAESMVKK